MQAPKNGFFYVLDRATGELICAEAYVPVTWAERVDPQTGRPVERAGSDYSDAAFESHPGVLGGHNWQPMAFNPQTGLVYIPAQLMPWRYEYDPDFEFTPGGWNAGVKARLSENTTGRLLAWDPVRQREAWHVPHIAPWNGGVLATAGKLVFQGTADGRFVAYDARDGRKLWEAPTGTGVLAPPITYLVDGVQYVTVMAGWGGAWGQRYKAQGTTNVLDDPGRIYTFALGANAPSPVGVRQPSPQRRPYLAEAGWTAAPGEVTAGDALFHQHCARCHGMQAVSAVPAVPDLRYASPQVHEAYEGIVLEGRRAGRGMPGFGGRLSADEARLIRSYLISRSRAAAEEADESR